MRALVIKLLSLGAAFLCLSSCISLLSRIPALDYQLATPETGEVLEKGQFDIGGSNSLNSIIEKFGLYLNAGIDPMWADRGGGEEPGSSASIHVPINGGITFTFSQRFVVIAGLVRDYPIIGYPEEFGLVNVMNTPALTINISYRFGEVTPVTGTER